MRPDKVIVSGETVVELAKCALVPIRCDAPVPVGPDDKRTYPCSQELSCWKTHFKHSVKKHSSKRKAHNGVIHYQCGLNKCSAKLHSSSKALKAHIETSHMKTFPLPCPFANCTPPRLDFGRPEKYYMFMRERDLVSHLKTEHSHLIGCELDVRDSEILLPSWEPRPPARPLPAPPDLPFGSVSVAALRLAEIKPRSIRSWGWLIRAQAEADGETEDMNANTDTPAPLSTPVPVPVPVPQTPTPRTPAGRRRLLRMSALSPPSDSPDHNADLEYEFDDLPAVSYDKDAHKMVPEDIFDALKCVHPVGTVVDLVRAQQMLDVPLCERPPPPTSIFHEALRQQVYAQYASGEGAATDSLSIAHDSAA